MIHTLRYSGLGLDVLLVNCFNYLSLSLISGNTHTHTEREIITVECKLWCQNIYDMYDMYIICTLKHTEREREREREGETHTHKLD